MTAIIAEIFSYQFIVRAIVVGASVSLCAALLGVSLVLKRYSMIGDGLGHVGFGSLCIAIVIGAAPLAVSVPVVILAALMLLKISEKSRIKGDAAIAVISSSALAAGIIAASLSNGLNVDVFNYMFGSILAMDKGDVYLSLTLSASVLTMFILFYNKVFAVTFDESFAKASGVNVSLYNTLIAVLTAVTIVVGMRIMGTMLISSLIVFPALSAMRCCRSFKSVVICSGAVSVVCFFIGMVFSYALSIPAGASIIAVNLAVFALFFCIGSAAERGIHLPVSK